MGHKLLTVEEAENLSIEEVWDLYRNHISRSQVSLVGSFGFGKELIDRAEGCYLITKSGKKLLDLTGGIGVLNHGHNHPRVVSARRKYADKQRMEVHKNFFSPYTAVLARNVASVLPGDLNISYFPNSGAEAVEGALKLAYKYHQGSRRYVLHSDISFHGKLLGAASLTGSPELHFKFPQIPDTASFAYGDIASFQGVVESIKKSSGESDVYAVVVEPLNASSMRTCSEEFLREIRRICSQYDILLIFDEVYTGWGKTGYLFNFMRCPDVIPDVVTYAKSFGGGKASISGYTCREYVFRNAYDNLRDATLHSTTYFGFGEETVTAIEAINTLFDEKLVERSREIGVQFQAGIRQIQTKRASVGFEARGSGALWGLVLERTFVESLMAKILGIVPGPFFKDPKIAKKVLLGAIINMLYEEYSIVTYYGSNVENPLIFSFPLVAGETEVNRALEAIDYCFNQSLMTHIIKFVSEKLRSV